MRVEILHRRNLVTFSQSEKTGVWCLINLTQIKGLPETGRQNPENCQKWIKRIDIIKLLRSFRIR